MEQVKLFYIDFPKDKMQYDVGTVQVNNSNLTVQTEEICCLLGSEAYDIVDYTKEISIIVDDLGLYKSSLPIWEIKTPDGISLKLIGKLLFVRNLETEDNIEFVDIKAEDIFTLRTSLDIKLKGLKS